MTRKGWTTITLKLEARDKFRKALKNARKENPKLDVSTFIEMLVNSQTKK